MRRPLLAALALVAAVSLAACGSSGPPVSRPHGTLTISNESGTLWDCAFNPFNPAESSFSVGPVYEPLAFSNVLQSGKTSPWLATSWAWSDGNKTLTFTVRQGVLWSDGVRMTAGDVAFTFNMLKRHPGLDVNQLWSVLSSVTRHGDKVRMTFKQAAVADFYLLADQTPIVSEHVWSKVASPDTYLDASPVGTGAYRTSCVPQNIRYTANPRYWKSGEPKIETVNYPAYTSIGPSNAAILQNHAQWGGQPIPHVQGAYAATNSDHHYWFPPVSNVSLFINLTNPLLKDLAVRRAMAYAINRKQAATEGEFGYEPAANQTGVVMPTFASWLRTATVYSYDPSTARGILASAGYKRGRDGVMARGKHRLAFTLINEGSNADWAGVVRVIKRNLSAVGIKVNVESLSYASYGSELYNGDYQLAYGVETGGPTPYYELRQLLYSMNTAPLGKPAASNYERYRNAHADALIQQYASTTNPVEQKLAVDQLELIMQSFVPVIPVTENVDWYEYNTHDFTGWVTPANPYAQPAPYNFPDWGWQLLHLSPKS